MRSWSGWRVVSWNVLERITSWIRRSNSADGTEEQEHGEAVDTALFYCERCDVTLISQEMEACPRCDHPVEEIPNEQELDRFHVH